MCQKHKRHHAKAVEVNKLCWSTQPKHLKTHLDQVTLAIARDAPPWPLSEEWITQHRHRKVRQLSNRSKRAILLAVLDFPLLSFQNSTASAWYYRRRYLHTRCWYSRYTKKSSNCEYAIIVQTWWTWSL